MKKSLIIFAGFALSIISLVQAKYIDLADIPSWAETSIDLVQEKQIMTGFGDGTFLPKKNINRAEALMMIFRIKGIDTKTVKINSAKSSFPDVPVGAWFEKAVIYATEQGWVKGFPNGNFHPEKELNKAELSILLQRVFELESDKDEIPRFSDTEAESWFKDSVWSLYNNGLIRHARAVKFFPGNKVSRAEAAWIFAEILKKPRLMGTSKASDFAQSGRARSSKRVAIRRRDLNVNKQGYDIEKAGVYVNVYDKKDAVPMSIGSNWVEVGNVILENKLSEKTTLDTVSFRIRFDNGVGPARNFQLKMVDQYNVKTELDFPRNGVIFLTNWDKKMDAGGEYKFKVFVKAKNETGYYSKAGVGTVYLSELKATTLGTNSDGYTLYKKSPIIYKSRNFQDIAFNPVVE